MEGDTVASNRHQRRGGVGIMEGKTDSRIAKLTIENSWFAGLEIKLRKKKTILGRNIGCDICLDDSLVSDEHATILDTAEGFVIEDLNSRNGLTINGREIHRGKLRSGDTIEIGKFRLKFSCHKS
jgi:pSer/pThr/pTyr-binding forkhead associated (FHA) protein